MKINNIDVKLSVTPALGEHFEITVTNKIVGDTIKEFFVYDPESDSIKLRLKTDTALLLSDFIDEAVDEMLNTQLKVGV